MPTSNGDDQEAAMTKVRLEAFTDGVLAVAITLVASDL